MTYTEQRDRYADFRAGASHLQTAIKCGYSLENVFSDLMRGQYGENLWAFAGALASLAQLSNEFKDQGLLPPPENSRESMFLHSDWGSKKDSVFACTVGAGLGDPLALARTLVDAIEPHRHLVRVHAEGWLTILPEMESGALADAQAAVNAAEKELVAAVERLKATTAAMAKVAAQPNT